MTTPDAGPEIDSFLDPQGLHHVRDQRGGAMLNFIGGIVFTLGVIAALAVLIIPIAIV